MDNPSLPYSDVTHRLAQPGSDVWAVHYDALARKESGEPITMLSVGDPDFDTPSYISNYVIEQINRGRTHYSPAAGETVLRETIAKMESDNLGHAIFPDQVVIFPGATATLFATLACILNPGDGVVIPEPMYVGYHGILETIGAQRQPVPLSYPEFELSVDAVADRIEPNTKAVLVNTPGNPCGNLIGPDVLTDLAQVCKERNVWLICDEVYSLITYEKSHISLLKCTPDLDHVVVVDGLSKSHAMSGWRVGWAISNKTMIDALIRYSGSAFFGVSQFVQDAAAYALANDADDVAQMRQAYRDRRDFVVSQVAKIPGLALREPDGGMFAMIDVSGLSVSGDEFSRGLLDEEGICVLPGSCFGQSGSRYVRLSLTEDIPVLRDAFGRIARFCETLHKT